MVKCFSHKTFPDHNFNITIPDFFSFHVFIYLPFDHMEYFFENIPIWHMMFWRLGGDIIQKISNEYFCTDCKETIGITTVKQCSRYSYKIITITNQLVKNLQFDSVIRFRFKRRPDNKIVVNVKKFKTICFDIFFFEFDGNFYLWIWNEESFEQVI